MTMRKINTPKAMCLVRQKLHILLWAATALCLASCIKDDASGGQDLPEGEYQVRLLVDPQTVTTKADDVSAIKSLHVYVFNGQSELVGYHHDASLQATGTAYYVPLRLAEGGTLSFYVVANESGAGLTLAETTAKAALDAMTFQTANINRGNGDLLTGTTTAEITTANAQGGNTLVVNCPLKRPFALLEVYFAKTDANMNAAVTDINLHDYTTAGYLCDSYSPYNQARTFADGSQDLLAQTFSVAAVVAEANHGTASANYGTAATSVPVTLNGQGLTTGWGDSWTNTEPSTGRKPRLVINYTVGTEAKEATVYLPRMTAMNTRYNVKCLIKDTGGLFVTLVPVDWNDSSLNYDLGNVGTFTLTDPNMRERVTDDDAKVFATQFSTESNASARQLTFTLNMIVPEGVRWMANLTNPSDFEFVIDDNHAAEGVGGAGAVTIQVRPTKTFDATGERPVTDLYITLGTAVGVPQSFDSDMDYTTDMQTLHIEQVSSSEGDAIWGTTSQP